MDIYAYTILNAIMYYVDELFSFLFDLTLFGVPAIYYILFSFLLLSVYKWLISPILSGGVSAGASDTVKFASNIVRKNQNDQGKWRDR